MRVFWKSGYEGASLPDLTAAMGINRPSLYAAFGNKESLFKKVVARYVEQNSGRFKAALDEPTARRVVEKLLHGTLNPATKNCPRGCMLVQGALACSDAAEAIQKSLACERSNMETVLRTRFEKAVADGDTTAGQNPAAMAKYVATVMHGIAVELASGADIKTLQAAADIALRAMPA
ncbi:MAG: putative transcriptional regulator, TetR family [Phycisphaerales bacterium]|nr:putative transcriptional regulator, TetR family [Phycisphaerales bacterium]